MKKAAGAYFIFIAALVIYVDPGLFRELLSKDRPPSPLKIAPAYVASPTTAYSPSPATSIYRENMERTGVHLQDSLTTDLKLDWNYKTLNVGIHGASKSSPAIDETGIYVGSDSSWFYAFDRDGKLKWKFFVSGSRRGIHGTAALDQDRVYIGAYNGALYCLDKKDGHLIWTVKLGVALGASPVLEGEFVYAGVELSNPVNGFVAKLRRSDGKLEWKSPLMGEQDHSSPTINVKDGLVYSGANNGWFYAYDLQTGQMKWAIQLGGAIKSTSTLVQDHLYVSSWGKSVIALNPITGKVFWKTNVQGKVRGSPTLVPGIELLVVADEDGRIYGLDRITGKTQWALDSKIKTLISSALVIKNKKGKFLAWIPCQEHTLCALDPLDGKTVSTFPLSEELTSVPVAWRGDLYLALNKTGGLVKLKPRSK